MEVFIGKNIKSINRQIEEVREMLNEICVTTSDNSTRVNSNRLELSMYLDELINEYYKYNKELLDIKKNNGNE